jgi:hypothetical protein
MLSYPAVDDNPRAKKAGALPLDPTKGQRPLDRLFEVEVDPV